MTNNQINDKLDEMRSSLTKISDKYDEVSSIVNKISEKLHSHLGVAEFVDKSSKKDIEELAKSNKEIIKRLTVVETDIVLIKNEKKSKKEFFIASLKVIGLFCVVIGAIYTLTKMGVINGPGSHR